MLKAVASECQRSNMMALHFANASETVTQSISSIIPPADISFVKVNTRMLP